jgi:hypothetical protein
MMATPASVVLTGSMAVRFVASSAPVTVTVAPMTMALV